MPERVCPWWVGYWLINPLRKLAQKPEAILAPYVREGITVLEIGPGMGFFTLELARRVGDSGKVFAVDVQEKMLTTLEKRARKAGLADRIETRLTPPESLSIHDLAGRVDFALIFAVAHEMPDQSRLFAEVAAVLKPGGTALLAEPAGHVRKEAFMETLNLARDHGLTVAQKPKIWRSFAAVLQK